MKRRKERGPERVNNTRVFDHEVIVTVEPMGKLTTITRAKGHDLTIRPQITILQLISIVNIILDSIGEVLLRVLRHTVTEIRKKT
jgi:hypothetical protein